MQFIEYQPHGRPQTTSDGIFYFPVPAIIRLLERHIGEFHHLKATTPALWKLVDAANRQIEHIDIDYAHIGLDDRMAQTLIAQGAFSVYCPHCDSSFTRSQVTTERWTTYRTPEDVGGGWRYFCSMGHCLLDMQDWKA